MKLVRRRLISLLLCAVAGLAACGRAPDALSPGKTTLPQLLAQMGQPSKVWSEGNGALMMEFARLPQGRGNFMALVSAEGVLVSIQQVLTEANVETLQPGMTQDQVRRRLGKPAQVEMGPEGEVWHWPLDAQQPTGLQVDAHFGAEGVLAELRRSRARPIPALVNISPAGQPPRPQL